jgi:DNA-binding protein H-NS
VNAQDYKRMMAEMRTELESLLEQQEEMEQKIAQLKQAIVSFAPLAKQHEITMSSLFPDDMNPQGTTESIREILRAIYPKSLSPVEIKEQLKARGQDLSHHKNVMASVHSTLKRMLENKEIRTSDEGLTYGWRRRHHRVFHRRKKRKSQTASEEANGLTVKFENLPNEK